MTCYLPRRCAFYAMAALLIVLVCSLLASVSFVCASAWAWRRQCHHIRIQRQEWVTVLQALRNSSFTCSRRSSISRGREQPQ